MIHTTQTGCVCFHSIKASDQGGHSQYACYRSADACRHPPGDQPGMRVGWCWAGRLAVNDTPVLRPLPPA